MPRIDDRDFPRLGVAVMNGYFVIFGKIERYVGRVMIIVCKPLFYYMLFISKMSILNI